MTESNETRQQMTLLNVRTSYLYVFRPYQGEDGKEGSYSGHLIFPETHPQLAEISQKIRAVAKAFWKDQSDEVLAQLKAQDRLCLHRGDINKPGQEAYKGQLFISANNKTRPTVVDGRGAPLTAADDKVYSGCWVNAIITFWPQSHKQFGKRINCELNGVQRVRDDTRLSGGGRAARADEFPVQAGDADGAAPATGSAAGLI